MGHFQNQFQVESVKIQWSTNHITITCAFYYDVICVYASQIECHCLLHIFVTKRWGLGKGHRWCVTIQSVAVNSIIFINMVWFQCTKVISTRTWSTQRQKCNHCARCCTLVISQRSEWHETKWQKEAKKKNYYYCVTMFTNDWWWRRRRRWWRFVNCKLATDLLYRVSYSLCVLLFHTCVYVCFSIAKSYDSWKWDTEYHQTTIQIAIFGATKWIHTHARACRI